MRSRSLYAELGRILTGAVPAPGLPWNELVTAAEQEKVAPLLYQVLGGVPQRGFAPESVMERLKRLTLANAVRNEMLFAIAHDIRSAFTSAGIDLIFLKGMDLAVSVYRDR